MSNLSPVIVFTLHVESSPQALPLGAACIASALKNAPFFKETQILLKDMTLEDAEFAHLSDSAVGKKIATLLAATKPSAICFSVYVWNRHVLESAADELRRMLPSCVLIAGGPEITAHPFTFTAVDYAVAGEGETAVPLLLESVLDTQNKNIQIRDIAGVYTMSDKNNGGTVQRAALTDLSLLSSPYLDGTLDPTRYEGALWELARGCPFSCAYCYESKGEKKVRHFPLDRLRRELILFATKNVGQVFVLDPTYNADRNRSIEILNMIREYAPDIYFNFEVRAEFIDRELARLFSAIPCSLQIGLQSADEQVLANVNRTFNKKEFTKKIGVLNNEGVVFGFDLIYGLPGDTWNGFLSSVDYALGLYPNHLDIFRLSVLPGTTLHETARGFGLSWNQNAPYHVIATPTFTKEQLDKAAELAEACSLFYSQGRAVSWFMSVLRPLKIKPSVFFTDFAAFIKSPACQRLSTETHRDIEAVQLSFLREKYKEKHLMALWDAVSDIVKLNGALCRALAEDETTEMAFHWHPEDLLGADALDIPLFVRDACREAGTVSVFPGPDGPDFRIL